LRVGRKPLKRPKKGLLGTLWRESEGVRRGFDRGLEEVGREEREKRGRKGG